MPSLKLIYPGNQVLRNVCMFNLNKNTDRVVVSFETEKPFENGSLQQSKNNIIKYIPKEIINKIIISKRQELLKPIASEFEYSLLLYKIMEYKNPKTNTVCNKKESPNYIAYKGYENADKELMGLVPYCGSHDRSREINYWLTNRKVKNASILPDYQMGNIIRVLDYSLSKLDRKYGNFKGIVYRSGYFNPQKSKQYYSASSMPGCAIDHSYRILPSVNNQYSIIRVKNGHKIYDFQKNIKSSTAQTFADSEMEVLIGRKSKFRFIPKEQYSKCDIDLKIKFIAVFFGISYKKAQIIYNNQNNTGILDNINIWEEI